MELSLLCIQSVLDGLETGQVQIDRLMALAPIEILRERILEMAFALGSMSGLNCALALSSPQFLDGMTSIKLGGNTVEYLQLMVTTLSSQSRRSTLGETIGAKITSLHFMMDSYTAPLFLDIAIRCPNLKSIELSICGNVRAEAVGERHATVFSNLEQLTINDLSSDFARKLFAKVHFGELRSLRLKGCKITHTIWRSFLQTRSPALIRLDIENVYIIGSNDRELFPLPMERLKYLRIAQPRPRVRFSPISNHCSALEMAAIDVSSSMPLGDIMTMFDLSQNIRLNVSLRLRWFDATFTILQNPSRFRLVDLFKENISEIALVVDTWDDEHAAAFQHMVTTCVNLRAFEFECKNAGTCISLRSLFDHPQRCKRLETVVLRGNIEVGNFIENCKELSELILRQTPSINDDDLIRLVERGFRLSRFAVLRCANITPAGIQAMLRSSGSALRNFYFEGSLGQVMILEEANIAKYCPLASIDLHEIRTG